MITWSTAAPVIKSTIEGLATTAAQKQLTSPAFAARWAAKRTGVVHQTVKADLILRVRSVDEIGADERRVENVAADGDPVQLAETIVGQRRIVIDVRIEHQLHLETDDRWAWTMAGMIRTRLHRSSSLAALRGANLAVIEVGPALDVSFEQDGRELNAAMFELTLNGGFRDIDTDTPFDWFERALITSHTEGTDGVELGQPPNYTDEPMGNP